MIAMLRDRFLELSSTFAIRVTGRNHRASVEIEPVGEATAFTVYSTGCLEGIHHELALQFTAANAGELRFKNQSPRLGKAPGLHGDKGAPQPKPHRGEWPWSQVTVVTHFRPPLELLDESA
jgi:hypothetical protein